MTRLLSILWGLAFVALVLVMMWGIAQAVMRGMR
jgi:hypothetical protein